MVDVARLAGVSQQTVSRVVNGHSNVSPEIRDRVEAAMAQLRYRRNSAARALATSRSMNLGVLSYALSVHGPALALFGISEEARRNGYSTSLVSIAEVDQASIRAGLDSLVEGGVDAIVVLAPMTAATEVLQRLDADVPVVRFEQGSPAGPTTISIDETLGAQLATRHLLDLGHRTVHFVGGPQGWMASEARRHGWQTELALAGRPVPAEFASEDWSAEAGYRAGLEIAADRSITAVLAINDVMALGVMKALHDRGIGVPGDVSVVGFDDRDESAFFQPALTTVRLDFTEVGRLAVESVLRALRGEASATIPLIQPELKVRDSTSRPR
ncbi:LacI family DNA-binding transcriptional regulator [Leifsonia sp. C5G2]|uniref:LacI family DNA-binding transcriptional regulator n=1 Tax=Leifsonia sp. C5G2 TaxID=2735269 RepID=UPI0015847AEA|nr:LacI family DNA-binding transcriptional regulator [Leifsonia sp. C5G2]NUU07858.1 LacI family DNA-binding transcriptional regulator [Leifsonia sp. C5G2]